MDFKRLIQLGATAIMTAMLWGSGAVHANGDGPDNNTCANNDQNVQVGVRPYYLVGEMNESELKDTLEQCAEGPFHKSDFSIGHRGAAL